VAAASLDVVSRMIYNSAERWTV